MVQKFRRARADHHARERRSRGLPAHTIVCGSGPIFHDAGPAAPLQSLFQRAAANGLVLLSCGLYANVIRLLVPLTASDDIIAEGLDIIETSLREILATTAPVAATG